MRDDDGADQYPLWAGCRGLRRYKKHEADEPQREFDTRYPVDAPIGRVRRCPTCDDGEGGLPRGFWPAFAAMAAASGCSTCSRFGSQMYFT